MNTPTLTDVSKVTRTDIVVNDDRGLPKLIYRKATFDVEKYRAAIERITAGGIVAAVEAWFRVKPSEHPDQVLAHVSHEDRVLLMQLGAELSGMLPDQALYFKGAALLKNVANAFHEDSTDTAVILYLRKNAVGGDIVVPSLDTAIAVEDGWVLAMFGKTLVHGVTPIDAAPEGYRTACVFYNQYD